MTGRIIAGLSAAGMLAMCLMSGHAAAEESYIGAAVGRTDLEMTPCADVNDGSFTACSENTGGAGLKLYAGQRVADKLAVEMGWINFGKRTLDFSSNGSGLVFQSGAHHGSAQTQGVYVQGVAAADVADRISILASFGLIYARTSTSVTLNNSPVYANTKNAAKIKFGMGAEFSVTDRISLRAELETYKDVFRDIVVPDSTAGRDADLYSLSVIYTLDEGAF